MIMTLAHSRRLSVRYGSLNRCRQETRACLGCFTVALLMLIPFFCQDLNCDNYGPFHAMGEFNEPLLGSAI